MSASDQTDNYRLYNPNAGEHFYTLDASEKNYLVSVGWRYEGVGWHSDAFGSVPVYRQYNPNAKCGSHNYTTSTAERDMLIRAGWKDEGVAWYASSGGRSDPSYTPPKGNQGTGGNLTISGLGVDVALYNSSDQSVVDAEDSAAMFDLGGKTAIADHASQAFASLKNASGMTAVITNGRDAAEYVCRKVAKGVNTGHDLVLDSHSASDEPYDLIMYTCIDSDGRNIWITLWNRK